MQLVHNKSKWLCVGIDKGGGVTKVGVTFLCGKKAAFIPLLVYSGDGNSVKDDNITLSLLHKEGVWHFINSSACWSRFSEVLQWLVDDCGAYVNGDWPALNAIRGLGSPGSTNPCPMCYVRLGDLLTMGDSRTLGKQDKEIGTVVVAAARNQRVLPCTNNSQTAFPILRVAPDRIVPIPLHVLLGLGNFFLNKVVRPPCDPEWWAAALKRHSVKQRL